jgi:CRP/FNR family transcriptional regulator, cyclic AMP receptor protein
MQREGIFAEGANRVPDRDLEERVALLSETAPFSVLEPPDLRELATRLREVRYQRPELIYREGEPARELFVVDEGNVKLTITSPSNRSQLVGLVGRGQVFGEPGVMDHGPRAMDARTVGSCRLYALAVEDFWRLVESRPVLARRVIEVLTERIRRADRATLDLMFYDAPTRLARRLLELAEEHGVPEGDGIRITARVTQSELAQLIGLSKGRLNGLIASFAARGWIAWNDGKPLILDVHELMHQAT